ncbi:hypothetical protein EI94DRAFT_327031 [Lactarius quietus]|nr:hypothetical protein EI94DRAFT_327031 [Lactarius quietus]
MLLIARFVNPTFCRSLAVSTEPSPLVDRHGSKVLRTVFLPLRVTSDINSVPEWSFLHVPKGPLRRQPECEKSEAFSPRSAVDIPSLLGTDPSMRTEEECTSPLRVHVESLDYIGLYACGLGTNSKVHNRPRLIPKCAVVGVGILRLQVASCFVNMFHPALLNTCSYYQSRRNA